jgi:hypothetical protein
VSARVAHEVRPRARRNGVTLHARRGRQYERTTPIGRARKNLAKVSKTLELVKARLQSWGAVLREPEEDTERIDMVLAHVASAAAATSSADGRLAALEKDGFAPPRRSSAVMFRVGERVRVVDKHREKYLEIYDARSLDRLAVTKVLPSGEVAVASGKSAFIVPKSHIARRDLGSGRKV